MYCMKCGADIGDVGKFCPVCGTDQSKPIKNVKKITISPKIGILAACVVVAVIAIIVVLSVMGNSVNKTPESVAVAFVESQFSYDIEKLIQCVPDCQVRRLKGQYGLSDDATNKQLVEAVNREIENYYTDEESTKIEVLSSTVTGNGNLRDLLWDYYGMTRAEYDTITQMVVVEVECLIKEESEYDQTFIVTCIEIDDKWYALDID